MVTQGELFRKFAAREERNERPTEEVKKKREVKHSFKVAKVIPKKLTYRTTKQVRATVRIKVPESKPILSQRYIFK